MTDPRPSQVFTRYVAIGDSFTEGLIDPAPAPAHGYVGWADRLASHLAQEAARAGQGFGYANLAVRGRLLHDIAGRQAAEALALAPDLVSIVGGGNDILRPRADIDALAGRLEDAVARVRATGAEVLMATPVDPREAPVIRHTRRRAAVFTAHIWSIARRHGAQVIDLWGMAALRDGRMWAPDRIHLNPEGHRRVAMNAFTTLGFASSDAEWALPLPPAPPIGRAHAAWGNARWVREHLAPWVQRRLQGRSSGDAVRAKRPTITPFDR